MDSKRAFIVAAGAVALLLLSEAYVVVGIWLPKNIPWSHPSHYAWMTLRTVAERSALNVDSIVLSLDDHCGNAFVGRACASVGIDPKVEGGMTADQAKQVMKKICDYSQLLSAEREGAVRIFGCAEGFARLNYEIRVLGTDEIIRWTD